MGPVEWVAIVGMVLWIGYRVKRFLDTGDF